MTDKLTILHISDLHSHFENYPKIQRFMNQNVLDEGNLLRIDLGDNVDRWHPMTEATQGKINVQLMNELGIDLATIGNNEGIGLSKDWLNHIYDAADFDIILGNLEDEHGAPSWSRPYFIYETSGGTRVAFLGYTFPYLKTYEPNGWKVMDPIECLKRDVRREEVQSADFRILLSHLGLPMDEKITAEIPEIELIIGSHTHHLFEDGSCLNGTYLAAAGCHGRFVGEINLTFEKHRLDTISIHAHNVEQMPSQHSDASWVEHFESQGRGVLDSCSIVDYPSDLDVGKSCQLVMEAMLDYAQAQTVIINSGLVVYPFPKNLTREGLHCALPHQMRLVRFDLSVEELIAIVQEINQQGEVLVNQSIRGMGFRGKQFGSVLYQGFDYKNEKIVYNGRVMEPCERISLVLVDQYYFARYFETVKTKHGQLLFPELLRELVEDYLKMISERSSMRKEISPDMYNYNKFPGPQFVVLENCIKSDAIEFLILENKKNALDAVSFGQRFSEILLKYDYIVGDWGNDQLRLKGFYKEVKNNKHTLSISRLEDYLKEYCNFGCAYFVLENVAPKEIIFEKTKPIKSRKNYRKRTNHTQKSQASVQENEKFREKGKQNKHFTKQKRNGQKKDEETKQRRQKQQNIQSAKQHFVIRKKEKKD